MDYPRYTAIMRAAIIFTHHVTPHRLPQEQYASIFHSVQGPSLSPSSTIGRTVPCKTHILEFHLPLIDVGKFLHHLQQLLGGLDLRVRVLNALLHRVVFTIRNSHSCARKVSGQIVGLILLVAG